MQSENYGTYRWTSRARQAIISTGTLESEDRIVSSVHQYS